MRIGKMLVMVVVCSLMIVQGCCQPKTARVEPPQEPFIPPPAPVVKSGCDAPVMAKTGLAYPLGSPAGSAVRLEKLAPKEIKVNEPFDYRLKVTNLTSRQLTNVAVIDVIPANLTFKSSTPQMQRMKNGNIKWQLGTLEANGTRTINARAVATGKGVLKSCADVTYDSPVCAQMTIVEPMLKLTKAVPDKLLLCDRIPVSYVLKNTGSGYACNIKIEDQLANGLVTGTGDREVIFELDELGPGQSREFKTMLDAKEAGKYASRAIATSGAGEKIQSNLPQTTMQEPILTVNNTGPQQQYLGKSMAYSVTVKNSGDGIAKDTIVELNVPANINFTSATGGGVFTRSSPGKVTWNVGSLAPNATRTFTAILTGEQAARITTRAVARAHCAETVSSSAMTTLTGIAAILLEVIDVVDPIEVGGEVIYVISVTNQGSKAGTNIQVACMLEDSMEYISSTGPTTVSIVDGKVVFTPLVSLAPQEVVKWQVRVRALDAADTRFKVTMISDQLGRSVDETEATTFYEVP